MELQQVSSYSQLRNQQRSDLSDKLPLPMPYALYIETSNRCNFKCRMCPVSFDDYETIVGGITRIPFAALESLYADLAEMQPNGRLKVMRFYCEGEPLLDKDLPRAIRLAYDLGITERTEVTSNGSALTENVGRSLIESGLTYLRISIYGVTETKQNYITQTNITAERIYQNVRSFRGLRDRLGQGKPFLYVKMIDMGDEEELRLFQQRYGPVADEIKIEPAMDWDSFEDRNLLTAASGLPVAPPRPARKKACPFPFYSLVIKANGDVVACCVDWNKHTAVGSIHEERFSDIWAGSRLREFRRMHLEGRRRENTSCANCWFLETVPDNLDGIQPADFDKALGANQAERIPLSLLA